MGTAPEIAVVARPTRGQIVALVRSQLLSTGSTRTSVILGLIGAPILFALFHLIAGHPAPMRDFALVWLFGIAYAAFLVIFAPLRSARSPSARDLLEYETRYRFSEDGVFVRGARGTSNLEWTAFDRAVRLRDFYALRITNGAGWHIIPAASFTADEDPIFRDLVRRKIGSAAKL